MKYDYQDRLIRFAGDTILFAGKIKKDFAGSYLTNQLIRSTGSAALNFGEAQGAVSGKDYLNKVGIVLKELKESEVNFKIMRHINFGGEEREKLLNECVELIKICRTIIKNKKRAMES